MNPAEMIHSYPLKDWGLVSQDFSLFHSKLRTSMTLIKTLMARKSADNNALFTRVSELKERSLRKQDWAGWLQGQDLNCLTTASKQVGLELVIPA